MNDEHSIISWDHREQPDWELMAVAQKGGLVFVTPVEDTGCDQFVAVMSHQPKTAAEAQKIWDDAVAEYDR